MSSMGGPGVHRAPKPRVSPIWFVFGSAAIIGASVGAYHLANKTPKPKIPVAAPLNDFVVPPERNSFVPTPRPVPSRTAFKTQEVIPTLSPSPSTLPLVDTVSEPTIAPSVEPITTPSPVPENVDPSPVVPSTAPFIPYPTGEDRG